MPGSPARKFLAAGVAVAALLLLGWFAYLPATNSVFLLDDRPNLAGLATVADAESALQFAASGTAGPVGRPLTLATFIPQAASWDDSAAPFIQANILIHLVNALLAGVFFLQLARARGAARPTDAWIAISAMALWMFLPLLASSSLMVVQRMTTLSAMFVLLGLNAYLYMRARIDADPRAALTGMSAALVLGTLLAILAKENGALLPSFALLLEATILSPPAKDSVRRWRSWRLVFLGLPTMAIVLFLLAQLPYSEDTVLRRGMTGWERLITEARVLWEYLFNAFVARPASYGPFHDGYPLVRSILDPLTLAAVAAWVAVVTGAILWRRKYPLAAFAALWFVTGHLLESTTYPLELYFEHRNYVPLLGPVFVLSYLAWSVTGQYRNIARFAIGAYAFLNLTILFSVTSLWGKPLEAAAYWRVNSPDSVRAAAHLAARQMTEIGGPVGVITLQEFVAWHPEHAYLRLHELAVSCRLSSERDYSELVDELEEQLESIRFDVSVGSLLDNLMLAITETGCSAIDRDSARRLAEAVARNPAYANNAYYMNSHHLLLAGLAMERGDREAAMRELERAGDAMQSSRVDSLIVQELSAQGRYDEARAYIEELAAELPLHPFRRLSASFALRQLRREVDARESQSAYGRQPAGVTGPG